MASLIEVVNLALGHLGQGRVESLNPNTDREAVRKTVLFADMARDLALSDHDWLDACQPVVLNALAEVAPTGFSRVYGLPEGFLRVSSVSGVGRWQVGVLRKAQGSAVIESRVLYAESALTQVWAIVRVAWETLSPALALAVSYKMAEMACVSVKGDAKLQPVFKSGYEDAVRDAVRIEAWNHQDGEPMIDGLHTHRNLAI